MTLVYVLWHRCTDEESRDHELMLGIYSTQEKAEQALARNCSPPLGQNPVTSAMPADPVAGERVGRHGAIEPSG